MRLLIGNDFSEYVRDDRGWVGWWVQRIAWFAQDGDVLLLPIEPDEAFLEYATSFTGTQRSTLQVVVAPSQNSAPGLLTYGRLADAKLRIALGTAIADRPVDAVLALWPDPMVVDLARALGAEEVVPGYRFVEQGGGILLNSKSVFRAIAAGLGISLPPGAVCSTRQMAEVGILSLLDDGHPVIVKRDYLSGGHGNEIITKGDEIRPIGARRTVVVASDADVRAYLNERWNWLTAGHRDRVVVERYFRDSSAFFVEFELGDEGAKLAGNGELLSAPFAVGQIMPAPSLDPATMAGLVEGGQRLCDAIQVLGYRGTLSVDAVVTPNGDVWFTEYNGRVTGSTHIYGVIGDRIIGERYGHDRVILERVWPPEWRVDSFRSAVEMLDRAGLAYDPETQAGVVLTNAFDAQFNGVMYCIVGEDLPTAWDRDHKLGRLFGRPEGC